MTDKPTKAWIVTYTDDSDRTRRESWRTYAYDARHAEEKFHDSDSGEGWEFISVDRPRTIRGLVDTRFDKVSR
jgi:hypothetical protein